MQGKADQQRKRQLFETWLAHYQPYSTAVCARGESIDARGAVARIALLCASQGSGEYIYLLVELHGSDEIPAYIGKSKTPVSRWTSHFKNLALGKNSYARWQERLLKEGVACCALKLYVIGQDQVQGPPLPGFPITIGSIEYQLIGLAADAFAARLLNSEGQAR